MNIPGFIEFNNINSYYDLNMQILSDITIPFPQKKVNTVSIDGRDGDLYEELGGYEDITIEITFDIYGEETTRSKYRLIKKWLNVVESNKLYFYDDMDYFYKVKRVEVSDGAERVFKELGQLTVSFICDPYMYSDSGTKAVSLPDVLYNTSGYTSKPIYTITGEGVVTLTVNENDIVLNVGQEIIVDCEKELIYREDEIDNTRKTSGSWSDLHLQAGKNTFSYALGDGATLTNITIKPNWREL